MKHRVKIIGAGFSGLTAAYYFDQMGFAVDVYEKSAEPGGLLLTRKTEFGPIDLAANGALLSGDLQELCRDIQLDILQPGPLSKNKFIFHKGKKSKWPFGFFESFGVLFQLLKFFVFKSKYKPHQKESLYDWGKRALSEKLTKRLIEPAFQGVYATRSENLSASLVIGPVLYPKAKLIKKKKVPRKTVGFEHGMGGFCKAIFEYLKSKGVLFHFNVSDEVLKKLIDENCGEKQSSPKANLVFSCGARATSQLLKASIRNFKEQASLIDGLARVNHLSIAKVAILVKKEIVSTGGFGCLFPEASKVSSLGVLFDSCVFPERYPEDKELLTFIIGESVLNSIKGEDELLSVVKQDFYQIYGKKLKDPDILRSETKIWEKAIPKYDSELEGFLSQISLEEPILGDFYLHGNYLGRLGLSNILEQSKKLANRINYELNT